VRLLADENIPSSAIQGWRKRGHDVLSVKESMPGSSDVQVLARAQIELRLVVTQDKDFGELAFKYVLPAQCGIVLFRLSACDPDAFIARMVSVFDERPDWPGHFAVVEDHRIRLRSLAPLASP
jgi:predicted nuclease of predicted toxin-antitoxin system